VYSALVIDHDVEHAERLLTCLRERHIEATVCRSVQDALCLLRRYLGYDLLIVNISDQRKAWLRIISILQEASFMRAESRVTALLCLSKGTPDPRFAITLEHLGARIVYERSH